MNIEAIKAVNMIYANTTKHDWPEDIWDAICKAIAEAEKQEPVGVVGMDVSGVHMTYGTQYLGQKPDTKTAILFKNLDVGTKLYTHPQPKREWVGLSNDDELDWEEGGNLKDLVKAIEAKLKEKNT